MTGAIIKRLVGMVIALSVTASALPLFFVDQYFRTREQLEEALKAGEITQEDYDHLIDYLIGDYNLLGETRPEFTFFTDDANDTADNFRDTQAKYRGRWRFDAEKDRQLRREDRFDLISRAILKEDRTRKGSLRQWPLRVFANGRIDAGGLGEEMFASRSLSVLWTNRFSTTIGNQGPLTQGTGLTIGQPIVSNLLRPTDSFAKSIVTPLRSRRNGVRVEYSGIRDTKLMIDASHVEGERHSRSSFAAYGKRVFERWKIGVAASHQVLREFGRGARDFTFVAPILGYVDLPVELLGESSIGVRGSSAHQYSAMIRLHRTLLRLLAFSYSRSYWNLESSGYAYSDYSTVRFDEIDFEYNDKRAGRRGVMWESSLFKNSWRLVGEIVRWRNRLEERDAAAARLTAAYRVSTGKLRELRLQTIWEDFDLKRDLKRRKQATINTEWQIGARWRVEALQRIARHHREGAKRNEWRWMQSVRCQVNKQLNFEVTADWRDADWQRGGNERLLVTLAQEIDAGASAHFRFLAQTRYYPKRDKVTDWEVRVETRLVG